MCILFAYVSQDPQKSGYQLILAMNREEMYSRPSAPVSRWGQHCISGQDRQPGREGGTWFGVSTQGKVGIVLDVLEHTQNRNKDGRGHMVADFLTSEQDARRFLQPLVDKKEEYTGYNLVLLEKDQSRSKWKAIYMSNRDDESPYEISDEIFGLSNTALKQPWQKVENGKRMFENIIQTYKHEQRNMTGKLLEMLNCKESHLPDPLLERQCKQNCISEEVMNQWSAIYVWSPQWEAGTRTNTVVTIDKDGKGAFTERTMVEPIHHNNPHWSTETVKFNLVAPYVPVKSNGLKSYICCR